MQSDAESGASGAWHSSVNEDNSQSEAAVFIEKSPQTRAVRLARGSAGHGCAVQVQVTSRSRFRVRHVPRSLWGHTYAEDPLLAF